MATHRIEPFSAIPTHPFSGSSACSQSYLMAGLRAGLIALALLGILLVIVLS
ncbi:MAG: hypothetical protein K2Q25_01950 [Mycobacteriaceae bacterium]|nr:hypothetical protein [Mycobacteriaceae bacterium]